MLFSSFALVTLAKLELRTATITLIVPAYVSAGTREWDSWIRATPAQNLPNLGL